MKITKLEHSGIVLEKNGRKLVFDPVEYAGALPRLENVEAIIITHIHADHLQKDNLERILKDNPNANIIAPKDAGGVLPNAVLVKSGDKTNIGGFDLELFGQDHASVIDGKVPCNNIGVVVDGKLVNPGDSFDLPLMNDETEVLFLPEVAPWAKISETIDFMKSVKPQKVIPVHDGLLSAMGKNIYNRLLENACTEIGAKLMELDAGDNIEI